MVRVDLSRRNDLEAMPNQLYVRFRDEHGHDMSTAVIVPDEFESFEKLRAFLVEIGRDLETAAYRGAQRYAPMPLRAP